MSVLEKVDTLQKGSKPASVAMATFKKFSEDKSTNLAALIAFWAFFSIFPLLLVLVTVLAYVLPASDKESVMQHVAQLLPLLDANSVNTLSGSWWTLVVGVLTALWSGLGVVKTAQFAFNSVWHVPKKEQPGFVKQIERSLTVLATIGLGLVLSTILSGFVVSTANGVNLGPAGRLAGYVVAAVFDVGLFLAAFRMLTERDITMRTVLPGAILSGVAFFVLQQLSTFIISQHLRNAQGTYGHFATVITLLWWLYLQSIITLLGAQLNVVLAEHLYPRSLVKKVPRTEADNRLAAQA